MAQTPFTRRELLKKAALAGLLLPAAGALASCATPAGGPAASQPPVSGAKSANNPLGIAEDKPFEIVIFDGGFGDKYLTDIHQPLFRVKHPKVEIKHTATKEIAKTLQPRLAGGNPPEVIHNSGANAMDVGALVQDNQLYDLAPLLDAPSWDDPNVKVRDSVLSGMVEWGTFGGKFQVMAYTMGVWGMWYSRKLFKEEGWTTAPKTWDEFTGLLDTIKKSGKTAPFTYAGKHPFYIYETILTLAAKIGGKDVLKNIDNLEDGAWQVEPIKQAATAFAEIGAKYLMPGTAGLDHIQTQTAQNKGKVAILPCGVWLENEQKDTTPAGFDYGVFPLPDFTSSDALPYGAVHARPGEDFMVAARSANPLAGVEYMRAMLSKEAAGKFVQLVSTPSVVKGAAEGAQLTPGLQSATGMLAAAGDNTTYFRFRQWYLPMHDEVAAATGQLMNGRLTVDKWIERIQKKAADIKGDSSVQKFTRA
ncbi:N-acetylglucosamine/diacetylchitobiose ABC transporter substrate-binding protein [Spongiactinospora sp. TRM90649]|uniref:N-acetylglucosamine/diacetylchitobiose ABC transporter substrate-binding protein n=1 Tax=Spongiactinospora sp. TRM90649 TaxID=3031114 RepID=UPI0023F9479F|nr:N-acetylglucosamine/diacetylchitobiose ABC transporter substrate-binding protein [Spongiactinospora sp. TRM90649]MDF5753964.1 N-acetylglucosamine/diacetylchitobiose ABC transporter substrate-binding protein [Spongiactinospora sp. TRM90649]